MSYLSVPNCGLEVLPQHVTISAVDGGALRYVGVNPDPETVGAELWRQGLTLVHFSAQPKPFLSHLSVSPCLIGWGKTMHPSFQPNVLTFSRKVDEFKPLCGGWTSRTSTSSTRVSWRRRWRQGGLLT